MDARPGQPYTVRFRVIDANGSPPLGLTSGGTLTLLGPTGATSASGVALALAAQTDGYLYATIAGSLLTALGTYRWSTLTAVVSTAQGALTIGPQSGTFSVGTGDEWTLRDILRSVRLALRDGWGGAQTGQGTTTTLIDSRYALGSDGDWLGSELVLFDQPGAPGQAHPPQSYRVTAFAAATGTFTFTPAAAAPVAGIAGNTYLLGNRNGNGWSHDEVMDAIGTAITRSRTLRAVSDQVAVTSAVLVYEYALPSGWVALDRVEYQPDAGIASRWQMLSPVYWRYRTDQQLLTLSMPPPNNALRLVGRAAPQLPALWGDLVYADGATIRDDALYELLMNSTSPADRQRAAGLAGPVQRARLGAALVRL